MAASDFDSFVARRTVRSAEPTPIDWDKRRTEWLDDLELLFRMIQDFLSDYISDGRIAVSFESFVVEEERLGRYDTRKMTLKIGGDTIEFVPVGAVIFGAWGRVDLVGAGGTAKLVLVEREATEAGLKVTILDPAKPIEPYVRPPREQWGWKIAGSPPTMTFTELTAETLQEAILEVANA